MTTSLRPKIVFGRLKTVDERRGYARQLVLERGSYAVVADELNLTRERVSQLAGRGLTPKAQLRNVTHCRNCGVALHKGRKFGGRCGKCHYWLTEHGVEWSPEVASVKRRPTHCRHGHAYTPENTYTRPDGKRNCRMCLAAWRHSANGQAWSKRRNRVYYAKVKADPVLWARYQARQQAWKAKDRRLGERFEVTAPRKDADPLLQGKS